MILKTVTQAVPARALSYGLGTRTKSNAAALIAVDMHKAATDVDPEPSHLKTPHSKAAAPHTRLAVSPATVCAPTLYRWRSSASAPCRSYRTSRASRAHHIGSTVGRSPGGASRRQRGRRRTTSQARSAAPTAQVVRGQGQAAKPSAAIKSARRSPVSHLLHR